MKMILIVLLLLAALGVWSGFYTVPSDSVAVVQRFGKYLKEVQAGLNFKVPLGVDVATIVPVKRQLKQEFRFAAPGATDPYQSPQDRSKETQMVTGDLNAALVESGTATALRLGSRRSLPVVAPRLPTPIHGSRFRYS